MKSLISTNVDANAVEAIKAAILHKDGSEVALLRPLKEKARQLGDNAWEALLTISVEAATELAAMARKQFGNDKSMAADVIGPLTAFVEAFNAEPEAWLGYSQDGFAVKTDVAAGFMKALHLLQGNPRLRMDLLKKFNNSVEKSVESEGMKVVLDTKVSSYTHQPLKPLSKRDLTAQIFRAVTFLANNPDGFTIH